MFSVIEAFLILVSSPRFFVLKSVFFYYCLAFGFYVNPSFDVVAVQSQIYKNLTLAHLIVNLSLGGAINA